MAAILSQPDNMGVEAILTFQNLSRSLALLSRRVVRGVISSAT